MPGPLMAIGDAVELPSGTYVVAAETRYVAAALRWWVWILRDEAGDEKLLAQVGDEVFQAEVARIAGLPAETEVAVAGQTLALRHRGEARVEERTAGGSAFWLAQFRHYAAAGRVALFTVDRDAPRQLSGEALDRGLVRVFRG